MITFFLSLAPLYTPKITFLPTPIQMLIPFQLYFNSGLLWFTTLFLWYTVAGVVCWGGTQRVGRDGFQWGTLWFSAKVNKELSYHTICCLWSVTHVFWTGAKNYLPASLPAWLLMVKLPKIHLVTSVNKFKEMQITLWILFKHKRPFSRISAEGWQL